MPQVTFRKAAAAEPSHVLYTADRPASWVVLVDGVERGRIEGRAHQYSSDRTFVLYIDGVRVARHGRLKFARREAERLLSK